jgi:hypothetical protein
VEDVTEVKRYKIEIEKGLKKNEEGSGKLKVENII